VRVVPPGGVAVSARNWNLAQTPKKTSNTARMTIQSTGQRSWTRERGGVGMWVISPWWHRSAAPAARPRGFGRVRSILLKITTARRFG
jgi:hypothetical protein